MNDWCTGLLRVLHIEQLQKISDFDLSVRFFLQLVIILAVCRVVGGLGKRIGQPQVVGEMIAGVLMGPSLLPLLGEGAARFQAALFPQQSFTVLFAVSQVALSIYMFLVGLEFRTDLFAAKARSAASVSLAGMITPFALGAVIALWLVKDTGVFFTPNVKPYEAAIYTGACLCITAFPMLARIIYERGLSGTSLGTLSLAAGAIDDAAAWCLLAAVLATFGDSSAVAWKAIGGGALYATLVLTVGKKFLKRLGERVERDGHMAPPVLAVTLMLVMTASWITDALGIYAVFGAFILGAAMPRGLFAREVQRQIEPMVVVFLLPLFFTYSGLKTRLDLVDSVRLWLIAGLVLAASIAGKFFACWAAARLNGEDNRTSLAIGSLMNARGLMELIILNIGLQRGIITPTFFSLLVIMAIVTTLMATPLFEWVYGRKARSEGLVGKTVTSA